MARIKQITLPSGTTYIIYDELTRQMITSKEYTTAVAYTTGDLVTKDDVLYRVKADITASANTGWTAVIKEATTIDTELKSLKSIVSGVMHYIGVTSTTLEDGSTTATITIDGDEVTLTADDAGAVVISGTGQNQKEYVWSGATWNEFGSTGALKALAFKDTATGNYDKATAVSVTIPTITPTTNHLKATASGGAATITSTAAAITGFGTHSKTSFVTSYPGTTSKLKTITVKSAGNAVSVPNVTGNTTVTATNTVFGTATTASKATAGTAITVAKKGTSTDVASGTLGAETSTRTADTPMWGATVSNETLSFTFKPLSTKSIIPADSNTASITPYTFADVTVPVVSSNDSVESSKVTLGTALSCAGAGTDKTVADGTLDSTDVNGATVMTGLGTAQTSQAITDLGTPTTANAATAISLSTQPTITLSTPTTSDATTVDIVTAVSTGTTSTSGSITHTSTSLTVS